MKRDNPLNSDRVFYQGKTMSLFARKCAWCGAKLLNPRYVERAGKKFCSEDHAGRFFEQQRTAVQQDEGCC